MKFNSALLTQTSGSIGGATGAQNRGGNYLRARVAPVQPRTVAQQAVRATLASISSTWKTLTASQIAAWNSLASSISLKDSLGNTYKPSGSQLYTGSNVNLSDVGASLITAAPAGAPSFPDLLGITATASAGTPTFTVVPGIGSAPTGNVFRVRCTPQVSPGKSYFGKGAYRVIGHFAATSYASLNIEAAFVARFGALVAGRQVAVTVDLVNITTGFASIQATTTAIVGA
jgi:hypothetical protein